MTTTDYARAFVQFNRVTPPRYFAVDIAIFSLPVVLAAPDNSVGTVAAIGLLSWLFVRGAALTLDDYFDAEADAIEKAYRPIPSGLVTRRQALFIAVAMLLAGLGLAAIVGPRFLVAVIALLSILASDPLVFNKLDVPGISTLVTVTSVSMASCMGWLVYGDVGVSLVVVFATTWFWDLSHDTIGAYLDRDGDTQADIQSLGRDLSRTTVAGIVGVCTVVFASLLGTAVPGGFPWILVPFGLSGAVVVITAGFGSGWFRPQTVRRAVEWNVVVSYTFVAVSFVGGGLL
ncbi:UbiA prenyltransferase family protein [Haloferax larsenii]|uniref:4-hydroxybenzoate polyprenyltransferase n=1 Tax=Haloferax larsenii TaxID=302484 RepID=A0A1H7T062_HALLR|nr:UbiA family prenyltransferase [Haloferax larsenii]SEL77925.1 4-hydroxybenzoate polyprenyltransferase [Haloferax larsenii]